MRLRIQIILYFMLAFMLVPCVSKAEEEPVIYVIQKGDTLWGLSERFMNDPFYWPNLWSKNQFVTNPHLIFPGQKVRFRDGHLEIVEPETAVQKAAPVAEPEVAKEQKFSVRGNEGWLMENGINADGMVIAGQHGRLILGEEDTAYTDIGTDHKGEDGKKYTILRKSDLIRHPVTRIDLGYKVMPLGVLQITHATKLNSRAIITSSFKEVEPGDLLVPYKPLKRKEVGLKATTKDLHGYIVESGNGNNTLAAGDVVYLDLGKAQGAEEGNMLYIIRRVEIEKMMVKRYVGTLPNEVIGALVIVETAKNTSTAIVVKSIDAVFKGNEVVSSPQ